MHPWFTSSAGRQKPARLVSALLPWVLFLVPVAATGANYSIQVWQTEEGLPQNSVNTVIQTRDGYLWLGTFGGLVRFDGLRFTVFNGANTPELNNGVTSLF